MKKFVLFLCVFLISFAVFTSLAYARIGGAPSEISLNNALYWAESLNGAARFPYADGTGEYDSWLNCTNFVSNAYGYPALYQITAGVLWLYMDGHPGDWNAPRGSLVFFSPEGSYLDLGHVAMSTGGGRLIQAGYPMIQTGSIAEENGHSAYLGWAWPPDNWPGRSDVLPATVYTWAMQAVRAVIVTAAAWAVLFVIKKIKKKRVGEV